MTRTVHGFCFLFLLLWGSVVGPSPCYCQEEIFQFLHPDTAAVIHCSDVEQLFTSIQHHPFFSDPHLRHAAEIATNDVHPLITEEDWNAMKRQWERWLGAECPVEEAAIVLHQFPNKSTRLEVSILLKARQGESQRVQEVAELLRQSCQPLQRELDDLLDVFQPGELKVWNHPDSAWLLISNSEVRQKEIGRQLLGTQPAYRETLADTRIFRSVQTQLNQQLGEITLFAQPDAFRSCFPQVDDQVWRAMHVDNLAAFAAKAKVGDQAPQILLSGVFKFKYPPQGLTQQWKAFEPVEFLPDFDHEIVDASIYGIDRQARYQSEQVMHDEAHGIGSFVENRSKTHYRYSEEEELSSLARSSYRYSVRYRLPSNHLAACSLDKIDDYQMARDFVEANVDRQNDFRKKNKIQLRRLADEPELELWAEPIPEAVQSLKALAAVKRGNIGFAIYKGWLIEAEVADLGLILESMDNEGALKERVRQLERLSDLRTHATWISYSTRRTYSYRWTQFFFDYVYALPVTQRSKEMTRKVKESILYQPDLQDRKEVQMVFRLEVMRAVLASMSHQLLVFGEDGQLFRFGYSLTYEASGEN